jgi:hypothetical protein
MGAFVGEKNFDVIKNARYNNKKIKNNIFLFITHCYVADIAVSMSGEMCTGLGLKTHLEDPGVAGKFIAVFTKSHQLTLS